MPVVSIEASLESFRHGLNDADQSFPHSDAGLSGEDIGDNAKGLRRK
jgi:hypothetical protein